jgi:YesN/AraC family two-component response regulator
MRVTMCKTLIVEDSNFFRQLFRETLHSRFPSMDISEASNGQEALEKIETLHPDRIFMDIKLPGENGLELTKRIKTKFPDVTIVILSGYDYPEYREAARRYKADHFLSKGSSTKESILTLVRSILEDRKCRQANA